MSSFWDIRYNDFVALPHSVITKANNCSRTDELIIFLVEVTGKAVKTGDGKSMKVPCKLNFRGSTKIMEILMNFIYKFFVIMKKYVDLWKTSNN